MKFFSSPRLLAILVAAGAMQFSCRPASYEVIKPKKKHNTSEKGDPNGVNPPEGETEGPDAPAPVEGNVPPTAHVEVILNNKSVVKVRVNQPVQIRPSYDTLDPDDIGKSNCANPGIVRADYGIQDGDSPTKERGDTCDSLAVPYTFTEVGDFEISMIVTSNENEKAVASMILTVIDANAPETDDGGFTITADPMIAGKGQIVTFVGDCKTTKAYVITWDFGDGSTGAGVTVTHAYKEVGQKRVEATCTEEGGKKRKAVVTIVVIDKPIDIPGHPTKPTKPTDPTDPTKPTDPTDPNKPDEPGQNPGQKPGQIPNPPETPDPFQCFGYQADFG